jgi:hypothetical protein
MIFFIKGGNKMKEVFPGGDVFIQAGKCNCSCSCFCLCDCYQVDFMWMMEVPGNDNGLGLYNWESGQKPGTMS